MSHRSVALLRVAFVVAMAAIAVGSAPTVIEAAACSASDGQALIERGEYERAVREFSCVIGGDPTGAEGYRGRAEAKVMLREYADAVADYITVNAIVVPLHPDAATTIYAHYGARLAADPNSITALSGLSFAKWWFFDYPQATQVLNRLLVVAPNDPYANLFRGSSRVLHNASKSGVADLERGIALDPGNPHAHFIVADAYTYGLPTPARAFAEATIAFDGGIQTPRVHAILAAALNAAGEVLAAAEHIATHLELVTTELLATAPIVAGETLTLGVVPGRVYAVPLTVAAGESVSITTSGRPLWDTIAVLLAPDGTPLVGSDDAVKYFAAFDWVAPAAGTYELRVAAFEAVATGDVIVTRK